MNFLLAPLQRLGNLIETQNQKIDQIYAILSVDLKKAANQSYTQLKKQTVLLGDIKNLLKEQTKKSTDTNEPNVKLPDLSSNIGVGFAIVTMAAALVASAGIFNLMPNIKNNQLLTALAIGGTFLLLSPIFSKISNTLHASGLYEKITGKNKEFNSNITSTKDLLQSTGGIGLAMLSMAVTLAASSFVFKFMSQPSLAQIGIALLVGATMIPVAFAFGQFYKALKRNRLTANKAGIKQITMAGLAMVATAGALVGVAYVLNQMPQSFSNPPPLDWTLKSGLALTIFSLPLIMTLRAIRGKSLKDLTFSAAALPIIAAGILSIGSVFSYLNNIDSFTAPPLDWTLKSGLALTIFSLPFMLTLKTIQGKSLKDLTFAAGALPLIGLSILGLAQTFSYLNDTSGFNAPPLDFTLRAGLALAVFSIPFLITLKTIQGKSLKNLVFATSALPLIASTIVGIAFLFNQMPTSLNESPPLDWTLKSGLALTIFSLPFVMTLKTIKGKSLKDLAFATTALPLIGLSILGLAKVFNYLSNINSFNAPPLDFTLKAGLALTIFSIPFILALKTIKGKSLKDLAFGTLALPLIAAGILSIGSVFSYLNNINAFNAPPLDWTLKSGLALTIFSLPFIMTLKSIKGKSLKDLAFGTLALPLIATSILGIAFIFNYLNDIDAFKAPPLDWTLKSGLALAVFGVPFILVTTLVQRANIGIKAMAFGALSTIAIAGVILATAFIFSYLPDEYKAPPKDWALSTGIALTIFAVPFAIIGALAQVLTPAGLVLGAAGTILLAGTMWVVSYIFSTLPDLSKISKNFTNAIIYPINKTIDVFKRFKDEIGIENMIPLAKGLLAISGGYLALTAALAGGSVGGVINAAANVGKAIFDGISRLFGGDESLSPISLLDQLISRADGIKKLSNALPNISKGFTAIAGNSEAVVNGITAFIPFLNKDNANNFAISSNASTKIASSYQKISKATQKMNVEAIKESRYMFEALTQLGNSNVNNSLKTFTEKLMDAVNELSETVENLQGAVGEQSDGVQSVIGNLLNQVTEKVQQVNDTSNITSQNNSNEDMEEVIGLLGEIEERLNRPLRIATD